MLALKFRKLAWCSWKVTGFSGLGFFAGIECLSQQKQKQITIHIS